MVSEEKAKAELAWKLNNHLNLRADQIQVNVKQITEQVCMKVYIVAVSVPPLLEVRISNWYGIFQKH